MTRVERFGGAGEEWDAFVRARDGWTHCHLWGWKGVMERSFGHECVYLAARGVDGALSGVLPLVRVRSLAFGHHLVSMPYLSYGGPLGEAGAVRALVEHAAGVCADAGPRLELRCTAPLEVELPAFREKVTVVKELPEGGSDALWRSFPAKLRSQVRRPEKEGMEVRFGAGQVVPFFQVFARHMRDLGTPTHPLRFFRQVAAEFGESAWFACAYLRGEPVAAGCALRWGNEVEVTWASALREHGRVAPNMLLYWALMRRAADEGVRRFNFGRCTPGSGTHRFKHQWGARDLPLWWYRTGSAEGGSAPSQERGAYGLASRLWRRVPLPVATLLGPGLRRGITA